MPERLNYGASQLGRLDADADQYAVQVRSDNTVTNKSVHTKFIGLSPEQYRQVEALIISFNL